MAIVSGRARAPLTTSWTGALAGRRAAFAHQGWLFDESDR